MPMGNRRDKMKKIYEDKMKRKKIESQECSKDDDCCFCEEAERLEELEAFKQKG
jgi:hypothetical protein